MKEYDYKFISDDGEKVINNILFNLVDLFRPSSEGSIFRDLKDKYDREKQLIKTDKYNVINNVYLDVKKFNSKHFKKSNLYQRMERLDLVEKTLSDAEYKIGNLRWKAISNVPETYEEKELLTNALESFDAFKTAIEAHLIDIKCEMFIHNDVWIDIQGFNETIDYKLKNGLADYNKNDIEIELLNDDQITDNLLAYQDVQNGNNPFYDDYEDEDAFVDSTIYDYMINEYFEALKAISFRLYMVYKYYKDNNLDLDNLDLSSYRLLLRAIHYYNLEDDMGILKEDDDYVNEYDSLTLFYKTFIYNLGLVLYTSVEENEEKEENPEEVYLGSTIDKSNEKHFEDLTHKLILELKKRNK